jgi:hypothetical protein
MTLATSSLTIAATDDRQPASRVRSESAGIVRLIAQATERSATFRHEIEAINATDGLVYVQDAPCGRGVKACLVHSVKLAGQYRLLRVKVDLGRSDLDTMAAIGHELRHALEVLGDPRLRTDAAIAFFYRRIPSAATEAFETAAACQAGWDVFDELRANSQGR